MLHNYYFLAITLLFLVIVSFRFKPLVGFFRSRLKRNDQNQPLSILQEDYLKGKISEDEYEKKKRFLEKEQDLKMRIFFLSSLD